MRAGIRIAGAALLLTVFASCQGTSLVEAMKAHAGTYIGSWRSDRFEPYGNVVVMTRTSFEVFYGDADPAPRLTYAITLTGDWTDGGYHYFSFFPCASAGLPDACMLARVNVNNTDGKPVLEFILSNGPCPASVDPAAPDYHVYTRRYMPR
jgi:hypothetical protein